MTITLQLSTYAIAFQQPALDPLSQRTGVYLEADGRCLATVPRVCRLDLHALHASSERQQYIHWRILAPGFHPQLLRLVIGSMQKMIEDMKRSGAKKADGIQLTLWALLMEVDRDATACGGIASDIVQPCQMDMLIQHLTG